MATILVTGGAGYVGSVCCGQLLRQGHEVVVVDDLSTGFRESVPEGAHFFHGDIRDRRIIREVFAKHRVDTVFHYAAKALIPESVSNPGTFYDSNVAAGIEFLEWVREAGVRRMIFSSTAAVYGNPQSVPITEDHPKNPVNSYGETKLVFERALAWYASAYGWGIAAMRYFNACGAAGNLGERHDPETHIIPLLLQTASGEREFFNIYGSDYPTPDGTCLRDYVHVVDIADAHIRAMSTLDAPGMQVFNIGTGQSHSVREVVSVAEKVTGKAIAVRMAERRPGDPAILCASPAALMKTLGWKPKHSELEEVITSAWEFHRAQVATVSR